MAATLAIVERAHRGTVEQQYAHVLWLAHALHRQSPMTVLLRGMAAGYALDAPSPGPLDLAGMEWGEYPDYRAALDRLTADGARVLVSESSLAELGLTGRPLHPNVLTMRNAEYAAIVGAHDRIWFL